jgi:hypothetical protein
MKFLIGMFLMVLASNTYAACVADVDKACKDEAECKAVVGGGSKAVVFANGKCSLATERTDLPDCKFVYDGKGTPAGTEGGAAADAKGGDGKVK